ncbi:MAG: hypothetical protein ABIS14_08675 [Sphingomonas sp.]
MLYSLDGGGRWNSAGSTAAPAVIGTLVRAPVPGPATIADRNATIEVLLAHDEMILTGADASALDRGTNLALIGDELVQFGAAEQIAPARWRLSTLWRGRRGTEAAIGTQANGDRFVLIERDALCGIDLPAACIGTNVRVMASGIGDVGGPLEIAAEISGASVVPPAPVAVRMAENADGDAAVTWVRRSRLGWAWSDGTDAPLGEERERYRITIAPTGAAPRLVDTDGPAATITAAERVLGPVAVTVRQVGTSGESAATQIRVG